MKTGLCSITFRQFDAQQVIKLVKTAGLDAIEWGGDIHVPPGDVDTARNVGQLTRDAGLQASSYGSYYKILDAEGSVQDFRPVLESALALGAGTIRIWAGSRGSAAADPAYRQRLVTEARSAAKQAASHGVKLGFEFHDHSLTDTNESAARLLEEINQPNVYLYWQPMYQGPDMEYRMKGLNDLKDKVLNLHVFHWKYDASKKTWLEAVDRRPLKEGGRDWEQYLSVSLPKQERFALMEFVRDDDPAQFIEDARTLKSWLKGNAE